ncbi:hypothetical protein C8R44DRAFT_693419 [Mycena epipterygia]|nr:hypothetical protein C8R44DRAFT_693419 [Mycena epipterygia]
MGDEPPPSYDHSFLDTKHSSSSSDGKNAYGSSSPPVPLASTSNSVALLRAYDSATKSTHSAVNSPSLTGVWNIFRRRRHSELPSGVPVETAVKEDVRAIVQPSTDWTVADRVDLLDVCAQLCTRHKLDFSLLLQEKSIQDHSALYWSIVNSPWPPRPPFDLIAAIIAHSFPLQPETIQEARRACISLRNQEMFQFLRMCPEFGALSIEDRFILGALVPPEEILVENMTGPTQPFSVRFKIPLFQKRMLLSREITLEFIARGRLWQLSFWTADHPTQKWLKHGQWGGSLRLGENSASTHVEFGLVFLDARPAPSTPSHAWAQGSSDKPLRALGSDEHPPGSGVTVWSWPMFSSDDSVCIAPDGSITGVLGVKLGVAKAQTPQTSWPETIPTTPEDECVVS